MSREPYPCRDAAEFWGTETPNADRDGSARPVVVDPSAPKTGTYVGDWSEVAVDERPTCIAHECPERAVWPFLCQAHHDEAMAEEDRRLTEADEKVVAAEAEVERLRALLPTCDSTCSMQSGPEEDCSLHGRPVAEVWEMCSRANNRAEAAEAKVAAVEALCDEHDQRAMQPFPSFVTTDEIRAVLSGPSEPTCGADITHRDDDHRQSVCVLPAGHASAHDDGQGCRWTDADHHEPDEPTEATHEPDLLGALGRSIDAAREHRRIDDTPCPVCGGDRLRQNFKGDGGPCHVLSDPERSIKGEGEEGTR